MSDYPLPRHAAYIWAAGDKIMLTFPGYEGTASRRFNSVALRPDDPTAMKVLWSVLQSRASASTPDQRKIASPATPTKQQIEEMRRRFMHKGPKGPKPEDITPEKMAKAEALLRQLGLIS